LDTKRELSVAGIEDEKSLRAKNPLDRQRIRPRRSPGPIGASERSSPHVYALNRTVRTHEVTTPSFVDGFSGWLQGISPRPQLQAVERSHAVLLLIRIDMRGKADKFGFIDNDG